MKILLISKIYPSPKDPDYGVFIANIEGALTERGGEIVKSVIRGRGRGRLHKLYRYFYFFLSVYKNLLSKDFDLIYVHFANHSLLPLLPVYRFLKTPVVINAHGGDIVPAQKKRSTLICRLTRNIINQCAMIIVPSHYYKEITRTLYANKNVLVSPSGGIELSVFRPLEKQGEEMLRLGYVSRLDCGKGWDVFLKALHELNNHTPAFKFHADFAGYGLDIKRFQSMVKTMNLSRLVKYHGVKKQHELIAIYASLDLFVFPTTRAEETLGLVGIEAMACGVPVIGSRIGGLVEYIRDGENGYLFTPGDFMELADKIQMYQALEPQQKQQMRDCAIRTAAQYGSVLVADDLHRELSKLIHRKDSQVMQA